MPQMMAVLAPGLPATPEKFALAVELSRITFPYLMLICLAALLSGVLNGLDRFTAAGGVLCAVQRRLDRRDDLADALRPDGGPCAVLGRDRVGRGAARAADVGGAPRRDADAHAAPAPHAADARAAAAHGARAGRRRRDAAQPRGRRDHRQPAAGGHGVAAVLCRPGAAAAARRDRHRRRHRDAAAAVAPGARGRGAGGARHAEPRDGIRAVPDVAGGDGAGRRGVSDHVGAVRARRVRRGERAAVARRRSRPMRSGCRPSCW